MVDCKAFCAICRRASPKDSQATDYVWQITPYRNEFQAT